MKWRGVMPAITTCFDKSLGIDHGFMAEHCRWLLDNGCTGIVALGSLGEGSTLTLAEKLAIVRTCVRAVGNRAPVVASISSLSTAEATTLAQQTADLGCDGLMVLPPYVYQGDAPEMLAYVSSVLCATSLSCMLYNNPIAYGTDFLPEHIAQLAGEHSNLHAVKESSADVRRISAIRALVGDELEIFVGVDDVILEGVGAGAVGWIAGLANALPRESVDLFHYALQGEGEKAFELYRWFLPLLRMDTVPKFVQLIKLVEEMAGMGNSRVRPPRLQLAGAEREEARNLIRTALANRPKGAAASTKPAALQSS
jgi:1-pyrroline-4-hydroxy-2-carboxylate deaminase